MALWQFLNMGTGCTVTHCMEGLHFVTPNTMNIHDYINTENENLVFLWIKVYLLILCRALLFSKY